MLYHTPRAPRWFLHLIIVLGNLIVRNRFEMSALKRTMLLMVAGSTGYLSVFWCVYFVIFMKHEAAVLQQYLCDSSDC